MKRHRLTRAARIRIFDTAEGKCAICALPIQVAEKWHIDHAIPLWQGGLDTEDNMRPAHDHCHIEKTMTEATMRAKETRVRARHLGIRKRIRRPMPGSRASRWRKRMDGTVERR
jgi:hypothetical protein